MDATRTYIALAAVLLHLLTAFFLVAVRLKRQDAARTTTPPSLPLIGHLHLLKKPYHVTLASLAGTAPLVTLRLGARPALLVSSYAAAQACFGCAVDATLAGRPRLLAGKHVGYSHTTLVWLPNGDRWRTLRRLLAADLFSPPRLAALAAGRRAEVVCLVNSLVNGDDSMVTLRPRLFEMVFNALIRALTRRHHVDATGELDRFEAIVDETFAVSGSPSVGDFFPWLSWVDRVSGVEARMERLKAGYDSFVTDIIQGHKRMRGDGGKRGLIDVLLGLQETDPKCYTDDVIKGIVVILLAAGSDTTTVTMEWAMALLLTHPEAIQRVRAEIDANVGTGRLVEESDVANLPYLQCVVKETHRLYPPGPIIPAHEAMEDCVVDNIHVKRGTMVIVNAWAIHRDPNVWDAPEEFRPERFMDAATGTVISKSPTLAFGLGRRRCPGEGMAMRIVISALAALVQCFEWDGGNNIDMAGADGLTMPMATPLAALCRPREFTHGLISASIDQTE